MKYLPWGVSAVLLALLLVVFIWKNNEISMLARENAALDLRVTQLTDANKKLLDDANKKIQDANKIIAAASLPEVAVTVGFRPALLGSGLVARVNNISGKSIPLTLEAKRPTSGQSKIFNVVVDNGSFVEIGHREGWSFVNGDTITVSQPEHKAKVFEVL